jgi:Icc-related predicted phosphoesterase
MKLLCITDLHGAEAQLDAILKHAGPADTVLLGGDITNFGTADDTQHLVGRCQAQGMHVWAVAGNCDSAAIDRRLFDLGVGLHGRGVVYEGLGLHGLSAMPPWRATMYQFTEEELAVFLAQGQAQVAATPARVVLSHAPPRGVRDRTHFLHHAGSIALREHVEKTRPALVVCGHIHEARGVESLGPTVVVNCGTGRHGHYAIAKVDADGKVQVELCKA